MPDTERGKDREKKLEDHAAQDRAVHGPEPAGRPPAIPVMGSMGDQSLFSPQATEAMVTQMAQIMAGMKIPPANFSTPEERAAFEHRNDLTGVIHVDSDASASQLYIIPEYTPEHK